MANPALACGPDIDATGSGVWPGIDQLPEKTPVVVRQRDASVTGKVLRIDDTAIVLDKGGMSVNVERATVDSIARVCGNRRRRTLIGLFVGAGAGIVQGVSTTESNTAGWSALFAGIWGGLGALIGAGSGPTGGDLQIVYARLP